MSKALSIVFLLFFLRCAADAQQSQTPPKAAPAPPYTIPVEAARQANGWQRLSVGPTILSSSTLLPEVP